MRTFGILTFEGTKLNSASVSKIVTVKRGTRHLRNGRSQFSGRRSRRERFSRRDHEELRGAPGKTLKVPAAGDTDGVQVVVGSRRFVSMAVAV